MTAPLARSEHLVVVGASLAGLRAVEAARRLGFTGQITLIGQESHLPYDRPPLSKAFLDSDGDKSALPFRSEHEFADDLQVRLLLGHPATGLDAATHTVMVNGRAVAYDKLIITTGATPRSLPMTLPGAASCGVHNLRTIEDAVAIREALDRRARVVIVGAGFIGSEVAAAARKRGLPVTIIERLSTPLVRSVGPAVGSIVAELHERAGTELVLDAGITEITAQDGHATGVVLHDGRRLDAELIVVGIGASPATEWLSGSGIELHPVDGGLVCGPDLATNLPDVFAAGDVVHAPNSLFDNDTVRLEHWTNAAEQGVLAARSALGHRSNEAPANVPYFWSDLYAARIQFVGLPTADEVLPVGLDTDAPIVLYRRSDRIVGALTVNRPRDIMKFRRRIADRGLWAESVQFADELAAALRASQPDSRSLSSGARFTVPSTAEKLDHGRTLR
ncbi:NAD(P)/FAD-dependent oxidoreductase [Nocardia sp. NPDC056611]|uniref:NAD(P)/FAD-dependent oxidoreductase n=1 Tax=Nocardia sp. NPDC056611 TaxID=3345877 RepID=UPI00366B6324